MPRVLLLYNAPVLPDDHPDARSEREIITAVKAVDAALVAGGHVVEKLGLYESPEELLGPLRARRPDVVFNLFEGFGDKPASEYHIASVLDWLAIPYTGCPLEAMVLGRDKIRTKKLLRGAGLPTAEFIAIESPELMQMPNTWPVMVKPAGTDASLGIDQDSVVSDENALQQRVARMISEYQCPVLVETYLPGPEFNVGIIENPSITVLPVAEMVYTPQPGVKWPIVSYASKWSPGSAEDLAMLPRCPAQINDVLRDQLQTIARQSYQLIGCRDYARIDIRLDTENQPNILEVNPNPDVDEHAGLARMLRTAGITYPQFIQQLIANHLPG